METGCNSNGVELVVGRTYTWNDKPLRDPATLRVMSHLVDGTEIVLLEKGTLCLCRIVRIGTGAGGRVTYLHQDWLADNGSRDVVQIVIDESGNLSDDNLSNEDLEIIRGYLHAR